MRRFGLIVDGRIATAVEQDSLPILAGLWVEIVGPFGPGDLFSGGKFSRPGPAPAPRPRHITLGALQKRLGVMRALAIENSSAPKCVALRGFLNRFTYADLDGPDLPALLGMLAQAQLPAPDPEFPGSGPVTAELIAELVSAEVQEAERP